MRRSTSHHCRGLDALCDDEDFVGMGFGGAFQALADAARVGIPQVNELVSAGWSPEAAKYHVFGGGKKKGNFFSRLDDSLNLSETFQRIAPAFALPLALPIAATGSAVLAPAVAVATGIAPLIGSAAVIAPDEVKNFGERFNIGEHSEDWKKWAKGFVDVATLGASRDKHVRDAVKELGEKWNVGNNSVDTLKSMVNVASILGAVSGIGTLASALLGSSTLSQGAMLAAKEYALDSLNQKIVGKIGEELADPYVDHLIRKARRDALKLSAEEQALVEQYRLMRPGVYSVLMMAVENPNGLTQEQMQVVVNYQRDNERERAVRENLPIPPDEDWVNYYTRFLGEYGVLWTPTEEPGIVLKTGGGLWSPGGSPFRRELNATIMDEAMAPLIESSFIDVSKQARVPQSMSLPSELKAALDSLYPPTKTV